jgi:hypothetical protein
MPELGSIGKVLLLFGVFLSLLGCFFIFGQRVPFIGRLPGDIFLERGNTSFFFPLVTCLILSLVLTLVVNLAIRLLSK